MDELIKDFENNIAKLEASIAEIDAGARLPTTAYEAVNLPIDSQPLHCILRTVKQLIEQHGISAVIELDDCGNAYIATAGFESDKAAKMRREKLESMLLSYKNRLSSAVATRDHLNFKMGVK